MGSGRIEKDERDVTSIFNGLKLWVPNIYLPNQPLFNMFTGVPASQELIENAKTRTSRGEDCRDDFFTRFVDFDKQSGNTEEYFDSIPKQPLLTFKDKVKKGQSTSIPEDEGRSFAEILTRYDKSGPLPHDHAMNLRGTEEVENLYFETNCRNWHRTSPSQ